MKRGRNGKRRCKLKEKLRSRKVMRNGNLSLRNGKCLKQPHIRHMREDLQYVQIDQVKRNPLIRNNRNMPLDVLRTISLSGRMQRRPIQVKMQRGQLRRRKRIECSQSSTSLMCRMMKIDGQMKSQPRQRQMMRRRESFILGNLR